MPAYESHNQTIKDGTSSTVTHTCSGVDRVAYAILVVHGDAATVTPAEYGPGNTMELVESVQGTSKDSFVYRYVNPPTASTVVSISWTPYRGTQFWVITYTGVDQVNPNDAPFKDFGTSGLGANLVTNSEEGDLVVDFVARDSTPRNTTGDNTIRIPSTVGQSSYFANSEAPGATGSVNMSWDQTSGDFAYIALSLNPPGLAPSPISIPAILENMGEI